MKVESVLFIIWNTSHNPNEISICKTNVSIDK